MGQIFFVGFMAFLMFIGSALEGCESSSGVSNAQQERGVLSIVKNQPAPDLGGYSFERQVIIDTYLARNKGVSTYTYMFTLDGKAVFICASKGLPIPYSTQLTSPEATISFTGAACDSCAAVPFAEITALYPPSNAAATLVQCVNEDGSVSPSYFEQDVFAMPYRIKADINLTRVDNTAPSFSTKPKP